jgi:hypothetical protein
MTLLALMHSGAPADRLRLARLQRTTSWVLQLTGGMVFFSLGLVKLTGLAGTIATFETLGVGQWFRSFTGGIEVLGALLLLVPATAAFGAAVLAVVMVGATSAHLLILHSSPLLPLVLLIAMGSLAWLRREQLLNLLFTRLGGTS